MRIFAGFFIAICFLIPVKTKAQPSGKDSAIRTAAANNAIQQYHRFVGEEAPLYNGLQYVEYDNRIQEGHPFFLSKDLQPGSILYDNILYENVPLRFDLVKKYLVIKAPVGQFNLVVQEDKVDYFETQGHKFIRLIKDSSGRKLLTTGFYDLLYDGKSVQLLKKETKNVLEDLSGHEGIRRFIEDQSNYYVQKAGVYHLTNSKSKALEVLKDQKAALKQYIRKNKLKFRANKESDLVNLVAYYDAIGK